MYRVDKVGNRYGIFVEGIEKPKLITKNLSNANLIISIMNNEENGNYFGLSDCEEAMYNEGFMPIWQLGELINKIEIKHTTGLDTIHIYFRVDKDSIYDQLIEEMKTVFTGSKYYLQKYYSGIMKYGVYDEKGKWWSSNPDSINSVFKTDVVDAVIHYSIDGKCSVSGSMAAISRYKLKELLTCCTVEGKFLHNPDLREAVNKLNSLSAF